MLLLLLDTSLISGTGSSSSYTPEPVLSSSVQKPESVSPISEPSAGAFVGLAAGSTVGCAVGPVAGSVNSPSTINDSSISLGTPIVAIDLKRK